MSRKLVARTCIGFLPVEIYNVDDLYAKHKAAGRNFVDKSIGIIELDPDEENQLFKFDSLLHEFIHLADEVWSLHLKEHVVRQLATSLTQAILSLQTVKSGKKLASK